MPRPFFHDRFHEYRETLDAEGYAYCLVKAKAQSHATHDVTAMSPAFEALTEFKLAGMKNASWECFQGRSVDKSAWFNMVRLLKDITIYGRITLDSTPGRYGS